MNFETSSSMYNLNRTCRPNHILFLDIPLRHRMHKGYFIDMGTSFPSKNIQKCIPAKMGKFTRRAHHKIGTNFRTMIQNRYKLENLPQTILYKTKTRRATHLYSDMYKDQTSVSSYCTYIQNTNHCKPTSHHLTYSEVFVKLSKIRWTLFTSRTIQN